MCSIQAEAEAIRPYLLASHLARRAPCTAPAVCACLLVSSPCSTVPPFAYALVMCALLVSYLGLRPPLVQTGHCCGAEGQGQARGAAREAAHSSPQGVAHPLPGGQGVVLTRKCGEKGPG